MEHPTYPSPSDEVFDPGVDVGTSRDSRSRYHRRRSTFGVSRETALKAKRRMPYLILLLLILSLVGVVVGLSITLTSNSDEEDDSPLVRIRGRIRISNVAYTPKYRDSSSAEYKEFTNDFIQRMDQLYQTSDYWEMYQHTIIEELKPGSLIVKFEVGLLPMRPMHYDRTEHTHNKIYNFMVRQIERGLGTYQITEFMLSIDALVNDETIPTTPVPNRNTSEVAATFTYISNDPTTVGSSKLRKESCDPNPCKNGGKCTIDSASDKPEAKCFCTNGLGGDLCQNNMPSKCESDPCEHGGICRGDSIEYTCECTIFYHGDNCEKRYRDPCKDHPCQNGATCYGYADSKVTIFSCFCPMNYGGKRCEIGLEPNGSLDSFSELFEETSSETQLTCEEVKTTGCLDIIKQNITIIPNPFGFGDNGNELIQAHGSFEPLLTESCHPDAHRVLCSLINPECPDIYSQEIPVIALFEYDLPCRSLCLEVGAACFVGIEDGDSTVQQLVTFWEEMCDSLPESAEKAICFLASKTSRSEVQESTLQPPLPLNGPSSCTPSPCYNGGTCFELSGETQCRCPYGFGGLTCDTIIPDPCDKNPCQNGGTCVSNLHYGMSYHWCQCPTTEDSHVYYGINCELPQEDESLFMPHELTCTEQFLPPECKKMVPYNTTSASAIVPPHWTSIEPWTHCHPLAAQFLCSILAPQCSEHWPLIQPCMEFCQMVDPHCSFNYAALGLHKFSCDLLPEATDRNSKCFRPP